MLIKDHYCLESIIEAIDRIIEYTTVYESADYLNVEYILIRLLYMSL